MRLHKRGPSSSERRILDARPEIDDCAEDILRCWHDLESCRAIGMVVGPIPWTAVIEWARLHRLDRRATMLLADVIRYLDAKRADRERSAANLKGAKK
jgi:hypothetical protein